MLFLDDEQAIVDGLARAMRHESFGVIVATNVAEALEILARQPIAVVVSDEDMPEMRGSEFLTLVATRHHRVERIMLTGKGSMQTAIAAINDAQVFRYHVKPCHPGELAASIHAAIERVVTPDRGAPDSGAGLDSTDLDEALARSFVVLQPIVRSGPRSLYAHEVLIRCDDSPLATAEGLVNAAIRRQRCVGLDRVVRGHVAELAPSLPEEHLIFVNIFAESLGDSRLGSGGDPLDAFASRVVLELTEWSALDYIGAVDARLEALRAHGYRFAIDDFGSGYASLSSLDAIQPEVIKLDAALVRGIDRSDHRSALVAALTSYASATGALTVGEGVETAEEATTLESVGCDLLQGYHLGRPGRWPA